MMSQDCVTLTVRSTIKKIDEITLRCPVNWTIFQLKMFVAMNHRQGQDYFKPEKTQFYFVGKILNDDDTIATALKTANIKHSYTLIAKFSAGLETENSNKNNEEENEKTNILDNYSKLFTDPEGNIRTNTNMKELDAFSKLPVMMPTLSRQLVKRRAQSDDSLGNGPQEGQANQENDDQEERNNEHQYIIKLVIRILVIFFLFRSHFQGLLFYIFLAVLSIYFLIKLSQKRGRQRQQQRQQQNQPRPAAPPNADGQPQNANQPAQAEEINPNLRQRTFFNKVKELVICFVSSLYPSWDLNLYIEDNPVVPLPEPPAEEQQQPQEANNHNNNNEVNNAPNIEEAGVQTEEIIKEQPAEKSEEIEQINIDKQPERLAEKEDEEEKLLSKEKDREEPDGSNIGSFNEDKGDEKVA